MEQYATTNGLSYFPMRLIPTSTKLHPTTPSFWCNPNSSPPTYKAHSILNHFGLGIWARQLTSYQSRLNSKNYSLHCYGDIRNIPTVLQEINCLSVLDFEGRILKERIRMQILIAGKNLESQSAKLLIKGLSLMQQGRRGQRTFSWSSILIKEVTHKINFSDHWISLVKQCLQTVSEENH